MKKNTYMILLMAFISQAAAAQYMVQNNLTPINRKKENKYFYPAKHFINLSAFNNEGISACNKKQEEYFYKLFMPFGKQKMDDKSCIYSKKTSTDKKLAKGYIYEEYDTLNKLYQQTWKQTLNYINPFNYKSYLIKNLNDSIAKEDAWLIPEYETKDVLGTLISPYMPNTSLLNYNVDDSKSAYEKYEQQIKINDFWKSSQKLEGRIQKSFGARFTYGYYAGYDQINCQGTLTDEVLTSGNDEGEGWKQQLSFMLYNCNGILTTTDKETYFFNSNGDMTNKIYENYAKYTYEYDDNNREIKKTEQVWKNGIWENSEQEITTYDPMLPYSGKLRQVWVNNNWENKHRTLDLPITVDNEGNKIYKYDYQNWLQGAWTDNLRFSQKMKGNSLDTTLYALTESWQNQKWDTLDYFKVEYNSQGLFTQLESIDALYGKDQALGTKTVYELDEKNNHLSTTVYGCDGHKCFDNPVAWEPSLFVQVGGQNDPQLDYWIDFTWDKLQNIWIKTDSITNAYDIEGEPLVMAYEAYQNNKIAWGEKYTFAYEKTSVGIQTLSSTPVAVYPNPNNGVFHVKYESEAGNPVEFIVKDVYGRIVQKIKTFTNTTLQKFDLSEESAGIYFLEINTERNRLVKRITKI